MRSFIIGILPKEECIVGEETPEPAPRSEPGDVVKDVEEAALFDRTSSSALYLHRQRLAERRAKWYTILQQSSNRIIWRQPQSLQKILKNPLPPIRKKNMIKQIPQISVPNKSSSEPWKIPQKWTQPTFKVLILGNHPKRSLYKIKYPERFLRILRVLMKVSDRWR